MLHPSTHIVPRPRQSLHRGLFELADVWVDEPSTESYAAFLQNLFNQVATPVYSDPTAEAIFVPPPYVHPAIPPSRPSAPSRSVPPSELPF